MDAPHVYVHGWALGCFQSYQYPNLSEGTDHVSGQLRGDKECPFSGVTKSGRVWRKVPESDAQCGQTGQMFTFLFDDIFDPNTTFLAACTLNIMH